MHQSEQKILSDIEKYGWHVMHVLEDQEYPGFSYTIGLYRTYKHPEIILVGLKKELAQVLLNNMGFDIQNGKDFQAGKLYSGILDDFECWIGNVPNSHYETHVGYARWFYEGDDFPLVQCVYPTIEGVFPWQKEFPEESKFFARMLIDPPPMI